MGQESLIRLIRNHYLFVDLAEDSIPSAFKHLHAGGNIAIALHNGFFHGVNDRSDEEQLCLTSILTKKLELIAQGHHRLHNPHIEMKHPEDVFKVASSFVNDYNKGLVPTTFLTEGRQLPNLVMRRGKPILRETERPLANIIAHDAYANFITNYKGRFDWNALVNHTRKSYDTSRYTALLALMQLRCPKDILHAHFNGQSNTTAFINYAAGHSNGYYSPVENRYRPQVVRHSNNLYKLLLRHGEKLKIPFNNDVYAYHSVGVQALPTAVFSNVVKAYKTRANGRFDSTQEAMLNHIYRFHVSTNLASIYMGDAPGTLQVLE